MSLNVIREIKILAKISGFTVQRCGRMFVFFRYDDLVVACPMYHKKEKDSIRVGGAIYIYIGINGSRVSIS